eukprot:gnl/Hemi2/28151_TR9295_c0_g1_i1.p1 gnl/Hemi2/28151_TR9295_c0_g1~~gnl/Hemi2/28151_TR9295_c0_g1_i1.p1  ORF type:complete len:294 (-),score=77.21 gnl/Hemi2/28151_TR9295_c0_g1_i1:35-868(-)
MRQQANTSATHRTASTATASPSPPPPPFNTTAAFPPLAASSIFAANTAAKPKPSFSHNAGLCRAVKYLVLFYYCFLVWFRFSQRGWCGVKELFWICNISCVALPLGLAVGSPFLVSTAMTATFLVHSMWVVDVGCYLVAGFFPLGNAAYVAWPGTSWVEIAATSHHVWFVPLCCLVLHRNGAYDSRGWFAAVTLMIPIVVLSACIPQFCEHDGQTHNLNINIAHGWWEDMKGSWPWTLLPPGPSPAYFAALVGVLGTGALVGHLVLLVVSRLFLRVK